MKQMNHSFFSFNYRYLFGAVILFITELMIALYVHDNFVRPYFGDYLVVFLLYCFLKAFIRLSVATATAAVLLFSYLIETLEYFHFVDVLGFSDNMIVKTVIGYGFSWWDMLAYTLAAVTVLIIEAGLKTDKN